MVREVGNGQRWKFLTILGALFRHVVLANWPSLGRYSPSLGWQLEVKGEG